jgi:hypothetical protein
LRSVTSASSSTPLWGRNPHVGLQGYVAEHLFTVTTLLIDRSLDNLGLRRNNFLLFVSNPNIQSNLFECAFSWLC